MFQTPAHFRWLPWMAGILALLAWDLTVADNPKSDVKKRNERMGKLYTAMDDSLTRFLKPNLVNGKQQFLDNCFACHGQDGRRVDFDRGPGERYLGTTANRDIEVFWAMVNFGDAQRGMGAFEDEIPLPDLLDIAAYVRTLPIK